MRVVIILCLVALAFGKPASNNAKEDIIQQNTYNGPEPHSVEKRDAEEEAEHHREKRAELEDLTAQAEQNENIQQAFSNEGAVAKQGENGQYVYASDFGGLIAQILQHFYKANCCSCGCDCECPPDEQGANKKK